MTGQLLGHCELLEKLGEGGMGVVYKARDRKLDRIVAVKVLPPSTTSDPMRKQRFHREARAASALNHPNIVVIHEIGEEGGVDFIVMEYVAGRTLDEVIPRKGLRVPETLRYATQIASALTAAHEAGITHRDLKPGNLMVTDKGVIKVLDFGLAKLAEKGPPESNDTTRTKGAATEEGTILGTVAYMSPEQAEGLAVDPRSDIFAFGSILYEMCTGTRAFAGETKMSTLSLILREDPKPVRASNEEIPLELERIINRCLRKNPSRRFQSTADLQIALEELREECDSGRLSGTVAAAKPAGGKWGRWAALAAGVAILGAGGVWFAGRKGPAPSQQGAVLTQLTFDTGLTAEPSYWAQGNLIAYASDRATGGQNLDIWIQQLNGGETRRLTTNAANDSSPDIAPDGSKIVFRSDRDGGGIYVVPTIGGAERKIAPNGFTPKFSPNGKWIAYGEGDPAMTINAMAGASRIMVVPADGGSARELFSGVGVFRPAWSADSKHILFSWTSKERYTDWYVLPLEGGEPRPTGLRALADQAGVAISAMQMQWTAESIYFTARAGDASNIWKAEVDPSTFQCRKEISRVTSSAGTEANFTIAGSTVIYANTLNNDDVYMLPIDTDEARVRGEPIRLTNNTAPEYGPTISHDGKRVGYAALMADSYVFFIRDLETGAETRMASMPAKFSVHAAISPDGKRLAWSYIKNGEWETQLGAADGTSLRLANRSAVRTWGGEPARMLTTKADGIYRLDPDSGVETKVADGLAWATGISLSMDGRYAVSYGRTGGIARVNLLPIFEDRITTEKEIIAVTEGAHMNILPEIAPNGNIVYFYSNRDGWQCLWAQRLNAQTKRPEGAPFAVKHFHSARVSPAHVAGGRRRIDTARDKIVFTMAERTGNIWRADLPR